LKNSEIKPKNKEERKNSRITCQKKNTDWTWTSLT
jgi:hypothetical protein